MAIRAVSQELPWRAGLVRQVEILKGLYGVSLLLLSLGLLVVLIMRGPAHYPIERWAGFGLCLEMVAAVYFGLSMRKPWVVSLIVFTSASGMIRCVAGQPQTVGEVIGRGMGAGFSLYQLWFFMRPETRQFFVSDGTTLF